MAIKTGIQTRWLGAILKSHRIRKSAFICLVLSAIMAIVMLFSTMTLGSRENYLYPQWMIYSSKAIPVYSSRYLNQEEETKATTEVKTTREPPATSQVLSFNVTTSTDAPSPTPPTADAPTLFVNSIRDVVSRVPSKPLEGVFTYVTNLLRQRWNHNQTNADYFKLTFREKINMSSYGNMMITRNNTPLGSLITTLQAKKKLKADNATFKLFPQESLLPQPPYNTCSVVGSSGILLGSQCGKEIDKADFVFRFNLAPTWGFQKDVGSKTDMTTMNPSIPKTLYNDLKNVTDVDEFARWMSKQNGLVWTPAFAFAFHKKICLKAIEKSRTANNSNLTFVFENVDHFLAVAQFWKEYGGMKRPSSTGFYFISSALSLCTYVNVYGFWPFALSTDGREVGYHYFNDVKPKIHDLSTEFRTIVAMHQLGLLKLHAGNCTNMT